MLSAACGFQYLWSSENTAIRDFEIKESQGRVFIIKAKGKRYLKDQEWKKERD